MKKHRWFGLLILIGAFYAGGMLIGGCSSTSTALNKSDFNYPSPASEGQAGFFAISENSQARCCLVIPLAASREENRAARTLQVYFKLATGGIFPLCAEDKIPDGLAQIHIGETKVARAVPLDLPKVRYGDLEMPNVNGYLIKTISTNVLIIRGATPQATILGAVGLLKRYLGIRRYWPGEPGRIGDVVPSNANLKLPRIEWRDWPYFISRIMSGLDEQGPAVVLNKGILFADFWRMNYTIPSNESYYRLLKAASHTNEPDLFPLINGKRFVPANPMEGRDWQPCVSNPKVVAIMAESIKEYFRANPDKFALDLCVNDGSGDCTCDKCRAMDAPGADIVKRIGLCDRYVKFNNQVTEIVAKEFPDKILDFFAYGQMNIPPTTVALHPMLMPVLCAFDNAFQMWDEWQKMGAKHMGVYFYHDDIWFILPKLDIHQSAKRLQYIVASGGLARHFYQEFYGIYPLDGMVGYVENELLWDPRQNVDRILEEFYAKFFGPARRPMKSFYKTLEDGYTRWLDKYGKQHPYGKDSSSIQGSRKFEQFAVLPLDLAEKAEVHLNAALAAAKGEQVVEDRVRLVKTLFDFALPGVRMYWAAETINNSVVKNQAGAEKVLREARQAVENNLAIADYKFTVIEQQPVVKAYESKKSGNYISEDWFYVSLNKGSLRKEVLGAIDVSFQKTSDYLTSAMDSAKAGAWWREHAEKETCPIIKDRMLAAAFDAGGGKLENMVKDSSFEERGKNSQAVNSPVDKDGHSTKGGLNLWQSKDTEMNCALTDEDAHSGKYSVVFWKTQYAAVMENMEIKEGDVARLSVWIKHNDKKAAYIVELFPRGTNNLEMITMPAPWKPGEWQKVEMIYTAPAGIKSLSMVIIASDQAPEAKIWIDDFFIGKYPKP